MTSNEQANHSLNEIFNNLKNDVKWKKSEMRSIIEDVPSNDRRPRVIYQKDILSYSDLDNLESNIRSISNCTGRDCTFLHSAAYLQLRKSILSMQNEKNKPTPGKSTSLNITDSAVLKCEGCQHVEIWENVYTPISFSMASMLEEPKLEKISGKRKGGEMCFDESDAFQGIDMRKVAAMEKEVICDRTPYIF